MTVARLALAIALTALTGAVLAQQSPLSPRQIKIFQDVARVDGGLTQAQYTEFWADFQNLGTADRERFRASLRAELPAILTYQRTLWLAARASLKQRKPVITPELGKEFELSEKNAQRNPRSPNHAKEKRRSAQALLEGAAKQTPVTKDGRTFQISAEVIEQVLLGLNASIARLDRLLSETWRES